MLRGVGKRFGPTWVLRDVHLSVGAGQAHAVAGLNGSGKSTLVRAVYGAHQPTEGQIIIDGQPCRFRSPRDALARGVAAVPQELPVVPAQSIAENIYLGMLPNRAGLLRDRDMHAGAQRIMAHLHVNTDVRAPVSTLDLAGQQLVTVARALVRNARVIVFDEPTSALDARAADRLREVIRTLRADGKAILFISQRLSDVFDVADQVTVLRNGDAVVQGPAADFSADKLVHWMVEGTPPVPQEAAPGPVAQPAPGPAQDRQRKALLSVQNLSASRVHDVSLDVQAGELVGLFGLPGSGASDILRAIYGADPAMGGTVRLDGAALSGGVRRRIGQGLAYVTGDRQTALVGSLSVAANMALPASRMLTRPVRPARERRRAAAQIAALNIQPPTADAPVSALSGGNQQKVVIGRWLLGNPVAWLLDDPTRGVDAQAQAAIYRIIRDQVRAGACALAYVADPRELHAVCTRGLLIADGRITAEIDPQRLTADELESLVEGNAS